MFHHRVHFSISTHFIQVQDRDPPHTEDAETQYCFPLLLPAGSFSESSSTTCSSTKSILVPDRCDIFLSLTFSIPSLDQYPATCFSRTLWRIHQQSFKCNIKVSETRLPHQSPDKTPCSLTNKFRCEREGIWSKWEMGQVGWDHLTTSHELRETRLRTIF